VLSEILGGLQEKRNVDLPRITSLTPLSKFMNPFQYDCGSRKAS